MRKRMTGIVLAGSAAALAIGLGAASALAATTLTVKVTGGGSFTGTAAKTVLSDNGVNVTCSSKGSTPASTAKGSIKTGTIKGAAPLKVAPVSGLKFNNCTGPLGAVTAKPVKEPYALRVDSKTNGSGQTAGMITGVSVKVSMTACSFTVTGSAPGYYSNSKHTLTMTPKPPVKLMNTAKLTVSNVNGCAGVVHNGDHPSYTAAYKLKPATVTIKST
jgi:hypothetical protein